MSIVATLSAVTYEVVAEGGGVPARARARALDLMISGPHRCGRKPDETARQAVERALQRRLNDPSVRVLVSVPGDEGTIEVMEPCVLAEVLGD